MLEENTPNYGRQLRNLRFNIGQNIHRKRSELHLTLTKFSELTGVSPKILDHYEMGKREIELGELLKIAHVLHVRVKDLL